jgi:hypothetical protein
MCAFRYNNDSLAFSNLPVLRNEVESQIQNEQKGRDLLAGSHRTCGPPRHQLLAASRG